MQTQIVFIFILSFFKVNVPQVKLQFVFKIENVIVSKFMQEKFDIQCISTTSQSLKASREHQMT